MRIGILDSGNSMPPSTFERSFPLSQKNLILFELIVVFQLLLYFLNLVSQLLRLPKMVRICLDWSIQCLLGLIQQLYFILHLIQVIVPLFFEHSLSVSELVLECLFVAESLHGRRTVELVSVLILFVIFPGH